MIFCMKLEDHDDTKDAEPDVWKNISRVKFGENLNFRGIFEFLSIFLDPVIQIFRISIVKLSLSSPKILRKLHV